MGLFTTTGFSGYVSVNFNLIIYFTIINGIGGRVNGNFDASFLYIVG